MGLDDCVVDIETTRPYKDGGYDGIGQYQLFKSSENKVLVDFFIQAKCYAVDSGLGVHDTSRVISRIKDTQFGIIVTTSYIGEAAFKEILEDGHPIVMITGKTIIDYFKKELEIFDSAKLLGWLKKKYN
ncbi:MAG TPA: restriction endonuclease [Bacilli bacterium]|nr:restriction endonuclease [Bacilli bacterium]